MATSLRVTLVTLPIVAVPLVAVPLLAVSLLAVPLFTVLWSGMILVAAHEMQAPAIDLDHVILSIDNLDRGIEQFAARTGVTAKRGGEHPGRGTQNALVSLGSGRYLEIIAPSGTGAVKAPPGFRLDSPELTLAGWALQTRAIGDVVTKLRAAGFNAGDPASGSRRTPDRRSRRHSRLHTQGAAAQPGTGRSPV